MIVNPAATSMTPGRLDVVRSALADVADVEVCPTSRRGEAIEIAAAAGAAGIDVVCVLGGDGTINEAINGLAGHPQTSLAVVPTGNANVFARALGLPIGTMDATATVLAALRAGRRRVIGLGSANGRRFACNVGVGLDAAVVRAVEQERAGGAQAINSATYVRTAVRQFLSDPTRISRPLRLTTPEGDDESDLALVIVTNTAEWTYLGDVALTAVPAARFDLGLDALALRSLDLTTTLATVGRMLLPRLGAGEGRQRLVLHDRDEILVTSTLPAPLQVDGDYVGESVEVRITAHRDALSVVL